MNCNICCEKFNKSVNAKVTCPIAACSFEACKTCVRTYLLNTTNDPHCMSCKNQWDTKFLVENLNRNYIENDYKKHRKQLLVDREISRTPELMNLVEITKRVEDKNLELNQLVEQHAAIKKQLVQITRNLNEKRTEIYRIKNGEDTTVERKKFIMPCPADNCKGYLSSQYKCEVCKLHTCHHCFEVIGYSKDDPHICREESFKSAEMIKKETKPCPKCGVRIFKISGCDQMWCTECKAAFSWNTGKIVVNQNIHNPHYYNYLRENGMTPGSAPRNPGDQVCGGLIAYYTFNGFTRFLSRFNSKNWLDLLIKDCVIKKFVDANKITSFSQIIRFISNLHRFVNHISNVDVINFRNKVRNLGNFDQITVDYILNRKTKDELASQIFKNDNHRKKFAELLNVYELLNVVGIEQLNGIYDYYTNNITKFDKNLNNHLVNLVKLIVELIDNYNTLISYCNKQLIVISYTYNQSVGLIGDHNDNYAIKSKKCNQTDFIEGQQINNNNNSQASCSYH
jgi:hypothetical protein